MSGLPEGTDLSFLASKVEVLVILVLSGGLLCALGWRWLGAAAPGVALLMLNRYEYDNLLVTHYAMLLAPALAVALVSGIRRWSLFSPRAKAVFVALSLGVSVTAYLHSGAGPGGGRFMPEHYQLDASTGADGLTALERGHALASSLPPDSSVASAYIFGTRLADRAVIWSWWRFRDEMTLRGDAPPEIEAVVLLPQDWHDYGRVLASWHGFRLTGLEPDTVAVLQRVGTEAIAWETVHRLEPPGECGEPYLAWPRSGLALCGATIRPDRRIAITVVRVGPPGPELDGVSVGFALTSRDGTRPKTTAVSMHGLINPADLPTGHPLALITELPIVSSTAITALTVDSEILVPAKQTSDGRWEPVESMVPFTATEGRETVLVQEGY